MADIPRCGFCHARLDLNVVSPVHICRELTIGTFIPPAIYMDPDHCWRSESGRHTGTCGCVLAEEEE